MDNRNESAVTGRKKMDQVRQYFKLDPTSGYNNCQIPGCNGKVKGDHCGNLKRHLKAYHPVEHTALTKEENEVQSTKRHRSKSLSVSITPEDIQNACVELVTVNGRPFALIDDSGFRKIIDPILEAACCTVTAATIRERVVLKAQEMRATIRNEVKGKFISLKVDAATRHDRGFLGINIQFIKDGMIHIRTLGIIELFDKHSAENLQDVIQKVLDKYEIDTSNIFSLTADNARNMVKLGKLLRQEQADVAAAEDNDEDELSGAEESDEEDDAACNKDIFPEAMNFSLSNGTAIISNVHCAAHTLQLAVEDALKVTGTKRILSKARNVAKALRTPTIRKMLKLSKPDAKKPKLDVVTRWNSGADMLESLLELKDFCKEFSSTNQALHLDDKDWNIIEEYRSSLEPARLATIRLQDEQLTPGSFYGIWMQCKLVTSRVQSPLAAELVHAMDRREPQLMENPALLAAIFLDPRFSPFLPKECRSAAMTHLENLWSKLEKASNVQSVNSSSQSAKPQQNSNGNKSQRPNSLFNDEDFQKNWDEFMGSRGSKRVTAVNIRRHLEEFTEAEALELSGDIFEYWESKKLLMPQLYALAQIVHATPATQVSVERLFSALRFIFSTLRANLKADILDDIMIIRCNAQAMEKNRNHPVSIVPKRRRRWTVNETSSSSLLSESFVTSTPIEEVRTIPGESSESSPTDTDRSDDVNGGSYVINFNNY